MNQIATIPEDINESHTLVEPEERIHVEMRADFDREDMDLGADSDFWLPPFMNNEMAAMQAWNWWYGSPKAVARAVDHLRSVRSTQALSILKRFRRHPGHALLTYVEAQPKASKLFHNELPEAVFKQTEAASRVFTVLPTILKDRGETFRALMQKGTPTEIAHYIEQAWPFMAAVHDAGGYTPPLTPLLIGAAMLTQQLSEDGLNTQTRQRLLLAVHMLMRQIPPRLAGILVSHASVLADAFSHTYKVYGITHKTFDTSKSFWEQTPEPAASLAGYLMHSCKPYPSTYGSAFDELKYLERQIVQAHCLPRRIVSLYEAFCGTAGARYSRLRESIRLYSQSLDVPFEEKNFPSDLIGRALDEDCTRDPATIQKLITDFIIAEQKAGNIEGFVSEGETRMATVMKANARIAELSQQPSVSNMIEIAKLAEHSRAEILRHQDWFASEAEKMLGYVRCWQGFYAQIDALRPAAAPQAKPAKSQTRGNDQQLQASLRAAQSDQQAAEQRAGELAEQLREANIELHTLRSAASAQQRVFAPQPADIAALAIKVAMRNNLSPVDVLSFFAATAPERVVVLEGVFDSAAAYKNNFPGTARMLDLMGKLVFSYLDAINSGTPDTQAREVFGTKAYSAKESNSTLTDQRMRSLREFCYEGKKRVFERHLKIGNGTGLDGMRIYFDIIDKRVVIAYVGPHMDVPSSN